MTLLTEYGFWMKLHPFNHQLAMSNAHDLVTTAILMLRPGSHLEAVGQISFIKNQGMIASRIERRLQTGKNTLIAMVDGRHFAMHDLTGTQHRSAKSDADALMA